MNRSLTTEEHGQEYIDAMGCDLGRLYSLLVNECVTLHLEWTEYKILYGTNPEHIDLMNQAAGSFFFRLQGTLWERTLLQIARLMDPQNSGKNKENVALQGLPELVDPAIRNKIDILLNVAQEKCAFAVDWRKRRIAHRDLRVALKENIEPLKPGSRLSIDGALEAIAAVLNVVEFHYMNARNVAYDWAVGPLGGAEALLNLLRDGLHARTGRKQRLMSGELIPEDVALRRPI